MPNPDMPEKINRLEDILLMGKIGPDNLKFFRVLYNLNNHHETAELTIPMPGDPTLDVWKYDPAFAERQRSAGGANLVGKPFISESFDASARYALTTSLRTHPKARTAFERLVRYGFVDLVHLPRASVREGRGRPPVGARLSPVGTRFFELFLDQFDPAIAKAKEAERQYQEFLAQTTTSDDV